MSRQHKASEWLPILAAAFPHTFFADPQQVKPLKINIDRDLEAVLPAGLQPAQLRRFLAWYVNRVAYLKALLEGQGRVDLTGAVVEREIPMAIRERARERRQQLKAARKNANSAHPTGTGPSAPPGQRDTAAAPARASPLNLEDLYAMAIEAKLELILKFSTLPNAQSAGQGKMAFALKTPDGQFITAEVSNKIWNKLVKANTDWPQWVAALTGTMGPRTERGFALATSGLQVFEKKAKAAEALAPSAPAPAPVSPPTPAPVTVTTGAGTATVTKRTPLSLKRDPPS
jgi:sRNA-binding protein